MSKMLRSTLQPQLVSLFLVTLILIIFTIVIYKKVSKQKVDKAPEGIVLFVEQYVTSVDELFEDVTDNHIHKPAPYIFTLITFLIVGNLIGLTGFESVTTSYSVTLTLALISWIGIYVIGITVKKIRFFKRYLNPLQIVNDVAPLISLSFRIFGNIIGGSTILYLLYYVTGLLWSYIPIIGQLNLLGAIVTPVFHMYFDIFGGLIQAFVFTLLTMLYWTLEAEPADIVVKKQKTKRKFIFNKNVKKEGV